MVRLSSAWHGTAGPGTESHTTWLMPTVMYGRDPPFCSGASGGYHQSHGQKALNFIALHQHLCIPPLCRWGGPCHMLWGTHTKVHACVCVRGW